MTILVVVLGVAMFAGLIAVGFQLLIMSFQPPEENNSETDGK